MTFLIDPKNVINFDRTTGDLETWWLFSLVVAGKTAATQARLLNNFLSGLPATDHPENDTAFGRLHRAEASGTLYQALIDSRLGQYNRLYKAIVQSLNLDLARCTTDDLEAIHGVGPKTARMFVMMSRRHQRHAALDTHVLKHLNANGIVAPKSTPPAGKKYRELEEAFLKLADSSGMTVAEYDLAVWKLYSHGIEFDRQR
jgi:thermostable 8-oxoguanine DNA glycosylase